MTQTWSPRTVYDRGAGPCQLDRAGQGGGGKLEMVMMDHGRQAPAKQVKLLVDSGVRKTLINEEIWKKMQKKVGGAELEA